MANLDRAINSVNIGIAELARVCQLSERTTLALGMPIDIETVAPAEDIERLRRYRRIRRELERLEYIPAPDEHEPPIVKWWRASQLQPTQIAMLCALRDGATTAEAAHQRLNKTGGAENTSSALQRLALAGFVQRHPQPKNVASSWSIIEPDDLSQPLTISRRQYAPHAHTRDIVTVPAPQYDHAALSRFWRSHGLTGAQLEVMQILRDSNICLTTPQIAIERGGRAISSTWDFMYRLEKRGVVHSGESDTEANSQGGRKPFIWWLADPEIERC